MSDGDGRRSSRLHLSCRAPYTATSRDAVLPWPGRDRRPDRSDTGDEPAGRVTVATLVVLLLQLTDAPGHRVVERVHGGRAQLHLLAPP